MICTVALVMMVWCSTCLTGWLAGGRDAALAVGIARDQIVLDPGIAFGNWPRSVT